MTSLLSLRVTNQLNCKCEQLNMIIYICVHYIAFAMWNVLMSFPVVQVSLPLLYSKFSSGKRAGNRLPPKGRPPSCVVSNSLAISSGPTASGKSFPCCSSSSSTCSVMGGVGGGVITSASVGVTWSGVGVGVSASRSWGNLLKNVTCLVIVLVSPFATIKLPFRFMTRRISLLCAGVCFLSLCCRQSTLSPP